MATESNQSSTRPSTTIVTITLLIVLAGILYLSAKLDTIEERLRPLVDSGTVYVPATLAETAARGAAVAVALSPRGSE